VQQELEIWAEVWPGQQAWSARTVVWEEDAGAIAVRHSAELTVKISRHRRAARFKRLRFIPVEPSDESREEWLQDFLSVYRIRGSGKR
jgi:hypothetical protein